MNSDELLEKQINSLIRDEIQEVINDYVDDKEETKKAGLGFFESEDELKVKISKGEVEKLIKQYKKLERRSMAQLLCYFAAGAVAGSQLCCAVG